MKMNLPLEITDDQRRRVRAAMKRGGLATRAELRVFFSRQVDAALRLLPEAVPQRRRKAAATNDLAATTDTAQRDRFAVARTAPDDAVCRHCGRAKANHGKMAFSCLPSSDGRKGGMFEPR